MNLLIHVAGWSLVHFVWQGAVIAIAAAAALRLVPATSPRARYTAASVALVAMLVSPAVTAARLLTAMEVIPSSEASAAAAAADPTVGTAAREAAGPPAQIDFAGAAASLPNHPLLTGVVAAWLAGVLLCLTRLAGGWWRVMRLHRAALAMQASRWQQTAERLVRRMGLRRHVPIVDSERVDTPTVVGWLRPVILLPIAALANLTPAQAEAILAHELAHVRRHDYAINLLQTLAETLLFYHPGVWWVSAQIRAEREHCCDDVAVTVCGNAVDYAAALEELEMWRARREGLALAATGGPLLERVRRVLRAPTDDQRPSANVAVMTALVLLLIAVSGAAQHLLGSRVSELADSAPRPHAAQRPAVTAPRGAAPLGWQLTETASFEIAYPPELAPHLERIGREAEAAYAQLRLDLRHELAFKPRLLLFATHADLQRALAVGPFSADAEHILLPLDAPPARVRGDLVHEVTHVFASDIIPSSGRSDLPAWIYEGLAEHERGEWEPSDAAVLREMVRTGTVPRISGIDGQGSSANPRLNQILGHAAFDFIVSRAGKDGLRRFLLAVRQAPVGAMTSAYSLTFGSSAADFERSFEEYLRARFAVQP